MKQRRYRTIRKKNLSPSYKAYLLTDAWNNKRKAALKAAGYACQGCHRRIPLDVHHKSYSNLYRETLDDLLVLCRECHDLLHHPTPRRAKHLK